MNQEPVKSVSDKPQRVNLIDVMSFTVERAAELTDANSVLGTPVTEGNITVIPVSKLSVGFAGGGADISDVIKKKRNNPAGAGAKVELTPLTFLVISEGNVHLMNIAASKGNKYSEIITAVVEEAKSLIAEYKANKKEK